MSLLNLQPGESRTLGLASDKYLIIRSSDKHLNIYSDTSERVRLEAGDSLYIADLKWLNIENPHAEPIQAVYQLTKRELVTTQKAVVTFANQLEVSEIQKAVVVSEIQKAVVVSDVQKPVDVSVANSSPSTPDVILPAGVTTQVLAPNLNRKKVLVFAGENNIQNLRIGCNSSVGAGNGGILAPGGNGELETTTGVWCYNPGAEDELVTLIELEQS